MQWWGAAAMEVIPMRGEQAFLRNMVALAATIVSLVTIVLGNLLV